jgi:O-antigen/teichoic acid export membrane protein
MNTTKKSIGIAFITQYMELSIQFVGVLILARLLTPADTGIFSVAAFLMALLHVFRDFGVINYIIQQEKLTNEKIQSAYGVAIILACIVSLIMFSCSNLVAHFYGNPKLKGIMHVMALSFAVSPFGSLLIGVLKREMHFKHIFFIKISSAICHVTVATVLATRGYGPLSLAWANFAGILSYGIVANFFRPRDLPWLPRFTNMGVIFSFGSFSSISSTATIVGTNMPDMVIAKVIDMTAVGYFSRGNGLVQLFGKLIIAAFSPFILPYFSQLNRNGASLKAPYLISVEFMTALAWPFFAVLAILASPIVYFMYGNQWGNSVPVIQLLCMANAISAICLFADNIMIANGHVKKTAKIQLISQSIKTILILCAAGFGLSAVALGIIFSEMLTLLIVMRYLHNSIEIHITELFRACKKSACITFCSVIGPLLITFLFQFSDRHSWIFLMTGIVTALAGWVLGIYLTRHLLLEHLQDALRLLH